MNVLLENVRHLDQMSNTGFTLAARLPYSDVHVHMGLWEEIQ